MDINNASTDELQELDGIGPDEANLIVEARKSQGGFKCIHDLANIHGLKPEVIQSNESILSCTPRVPKCCCSYLASVTPREPCRVSILRNIAKSADRDLPGTSSECDGHAPEEADVEDNSAGSTSSATKEAEISSIASSVRKLLRGSSSLDNHDYSEPVSEAEMDSSGEEEIDVITGEVSSIRTEKTEIVGKVGETCVTTVVVSIPEKPLFQMKRKSDVVDAKVDTPGKKPCRTLEVCKTTLGDISVDSGTADNDVDFESGICSPLAIATRILPLERRIGKVKPPPYLEEWLGTFQSWTGAQRLAALDQLIETCEPTQIRHMMCVIEPQFQRDFISLLPKELALYVLAFLEPRDLLRAAQTCRNWRILAEDNLLWREKCREAGIEDFREVLGKRKMRSSSSISSLIASSPGSLAICSLSSTNNDSLIPSPCKAAFMMHHNIEMNWRYHPIRTPKVLKGHDDHVITCLQFSGNRIVSGSDDNTLKVWSASSGKCLRTLQGHTGGVWSSQMSGNIIISGSTDRTLKVWNADSGHCIHTLYGHTSTVRCMHLHGSRVVSGSRDATLRLWDIEKGNCLHVLVGHVAAVRCVQYNGRLVVSGAYDYMVKVWNPEREECLHTLQGHTNRVYSLQFDGIHVVSGSLDTSIRVWDVETGSCKHMLMGHQSLTSGMELRNNILVSGNADSTVKVWDILTGQCLQTLAGSHKHQSAVTCLQFNNKFVITSSDDGTVKLWDLKTGDFIRNLVALESGGSGGVVWRIRASSTKLVCAVGSRNGTEETKLVVLDFDVEQK